MMPETVAACLLVEVLGEDGDMFTMGPYEDDEHEEIVARETLHQLRPYDTILVLAEPHDNPILTPEIRDEYEGACCLAMNAEGLVTAVAWDVEHRE
jgi:hypothetical protein